MTRLAHIIPLLILTASALAAADAGFEILSPERTGIDCIHSWEPANKYRHLLEYAFAGAGVCVGDYDNDGWPDVYVSRPIDGGRLYRNTKNFTFEDVTESAGLTTGAWTTGATFADVNNDGALDLYVCVYDGPNQLFINNGGQGSDSADSPQADSAGSPQAGQVVTFAESAKAYGLDFTGASIMMAFSDYDRDGDLDGYLVTNNHSVSQPAERPQPGDDESLIRLAMQYPEHFGAIKTADGKLHPTRAGQRDYLFRNDSPSSTSPRPRSGQAGRATFTDVTKQAGIRGFDQGLAATWWDFDNDSWPDLYVSNDFWGPDYLYHNNRDGTFTDLAPLLIPHSPWFSMGSDLGDINNDGHIDFIAVDMSATNHYKSKLNMGEMNTQGWLLEFGAPRQYMRNAVYLNSGVGRMLEAAQLIGMASTDWTWSVKFGDLDNDGRQDVFFTNGMTRDFINTDARSEFNRLLADQAIAPGVKTKRQFEFWESRSQQKEYNKAYRNLGDLRFEDIGAAWGLDHLGVSFGAAFADLDGDRDLDIIITNFNDTPTVYRNRRTTGDALLVQLRGTKSNRFGIGARVTVTYGDEIQVRELTLARGFESANDSILHFGLAGIDKIDRLTVQWPSGIAQVLTDIEPHQSLTITEPAGPVPDIRPAPAAEDSADSAYPEFEDPPPAPRTPLARNSPKGNGGNPELGTQRLFANVSEYMTAHHQDPVFDDFVRQPLLPGRLSQLGPGTAWGDIDGDGSDDMFLGGAAGHEATIIGAGKGTDQAAEPIRLDYPVSEDMGALFLDVDADGDADLYVVSGGVECKLGNKSLRDRLYLNDGAGGLKKAPKAHLPDLRNSGGPVVAADFDHDGDLDLFVGGRVVPGQYPTTPESCLLRNDAGKFTDVTDAVAPEVKLCGMVTGALWSDADGDGWVDLLVTCEWGPIRFFRNARSTASASSGQAGSGEARKLTERTESAGLAELVGWWNGITGGDIDGDDDIDYVVTNVGFNTKYGEPNVDHPTTLHYGDFGSGQPRLLEVELEDGRALPARGKSCSTHAMPFLADKFKTFHDFASATLAEIYTPTCLADADTWTATTFATGVLRNNGDGTFEFEPLPRIAQIAPGYGVSVTDVDGDGHADIYLVQNFYGPQRETGRFDGGVSLLLLGDGTGAFEPVWPDRSGLVVSGDAKSLTTTDLNGDDRPDFVVGVNNSRALAFENRTDSNFVAMRLAGKPGNPTSIGARVTIVDSNDQRQTAEIYAGSGYLSQSSPQLFFGMPEGTEMKSVIIHWPDGTTSTH